MEFGNLYHLLTCPICLEPYNQSTQVPLIIPCSNGHTICRQCAQKLMDISGNNKCFCPLDKEAFENHKNISTFQKSLDLTAFINHFNRFQLCQDHPHCLLEFFCITCRISICYRCEKKNHQGHVTDDIESIKKGANQSRTRLEKCLKDINNNIFERRKFIDQKEFEVRKVLHQIKTGKAEIEAYFLKLRTQKLFDEAPELDNIMRWKETTEEELNLLESDLWNASNCSQIPYIVFDQEEIMKMLDVETWIENEKKNLNSFKSRVNIFIESNEEIFQALSKMNEVLRQSALKEINSMKTMGKVKLSKITSNLNVNDEGFRRSKNQLRRGKAKQQRLKMKR